MITISQTYVRTINEDQRADGYMALNASGKGKVVAAVAGPVEIAPLGFGDGGKLDDGVYALRDILDFASRGERGLSIVVR